MKVCKNNDLLLFGFLKHFGYFLVLVRFHFVVSCCYYFVVSGSRKVCMFASRNLYEVLVLEGIYAVVVCV